MNTFVSMDVIESCVPCQREIMEDGIKIRNRPKSYLLRVLIIEKNQMEAP